MAENTGVKQRRGGFKPGQSGNPAGKPKGARHKTTIALEALIDGEAQALVKSAIDQAKNGDSSLTRALLDRLVPVRRTRSLTIKLPTITTANDVTAAMGKVIDAMSNGEIDPDEAANIAGILEANRRAIETGELSARLEKLEKQEAERTK